MLKKILFILFIIFCKISFGQTFLNGSFEKNIATGQTNVSNHQYDSIMCYSTSFGNNIFGRNSDKSVLISAGAQCGQWCVYLFGDNVLESSNTGIYQYDTSDSISLQLSSQLIQGHSYSMSFYFHCSRFPYNNFASIRIGISTTNNTFGQLLDTASASSYNSPNILYKKNISFVAPFSASFVTIAVDHIRNSEDDSLLNHITWYSSGYRYENITIIGIDNFTINDDFTLGNDTTLCSGSSLILKTTPLEQNYGNPKPTYLWQNNNTDSIYSVSQPGTYWVKVTNNCDTKTDTIHVSMYNLPSLNFVHDTIICDGSSLTINAKDSAYNNYQWNTGVTTPQIKVSQPGKYIVTASNGNCSIKDSTNLSLYLLPSLHLPKDTIVCLSQLGAVILNAGKFKTYYWYPTGERTQIIAAVNPEIYMVVVSDSNNCIGSDTTLIDDNCPYQLYMPNVFTPTNDLLNETFKGYGMGIAQFEMHIYNRWGEELFSTTDINKGWDGTFKNNPCMADVYVWQVTYRLKNETFLRTDKGNVTLLK